MGGKNRIEISIGNAPRGFRVNVSLGKHGQVWFPAPKWEDAADAVVAMEYLLKTVLRDQTLKLAPLPICSSCKSEKVWEKSLDGQWSRFCMDCDHVEHL